MTVLGWGVRNVLVGVQSLARAGVEDFKGAFDARVGALLLKEIQQHTGELQPVPLAFLPALFVPA